MNGKAAREFSQERRDKLADGGAAMPDGSYPIPDKDALRRAIASYGRAKDPAAVKRHIIKRARALGATDMLPEDWSAKGSRAAGHAMQGAQVLQDLFCLISLEADEPDQVADLQAAVDSVERWLGKERREIGQPGDSDDQPDGAMPGKATLGRKLVELKAEGLTEKGLEAWLAGERSRRVVVIPFGGPVPSEKSSIGVDIDNEWFDADTDLYGSFPSLKASRERIVDWHHDDYDTPEQVRRMKGAILGKVVLDEGPSTLKSDEGEFDGVLADFWANAGERRLALIRDLQRRGKPLFGSSQAVAKAVRVAASGHIDRWPIYRHTITTSPQNTYAVVPPLKGLLTADLPFDQVGLAALKAAMVGLEDLTTDLHATSRGGERAATGRLLLDALVEAERLLPRLQAKAHARSN